MEEINIPQASKFLDFCNQINSKLKSGLNQKNIIPNSEYKSEVIELKISRIERTNIYTEYDCLLYIERKDKFPDQNGIKTIQFKTNFLIRWHEFEEKAKSKSKIAIYRSYYQSNCQGKFSPNDIDLDEKVIDCIVKACIK